LKIKDSFHTYAIITIIFWSLAYVLTRMALHYFSAFPLGFLRYFFASLAIIVIALIKKMKLPQKADIKWFIASGACGFFIYMIVFNKGCETVTAATGSVIISTVPVITALLARLIYKEKLSVFQWTAIAVEFLGVVVLTLMNNAFSLNHGIIWLLTAAVFLSIYNLLQRKLTKTYSGLQSSSFSILFGTLMLAIFLPATVKEVQSAPLAPIIYVAILGVFSSAIAYAAWAEAFKKAKKASSVSNYMFVTPFLTTILGFILTNEKPDAATYIGGGIILIGLFTFNFGERIYKNMKQKTAELD
jgi:drug/metabolite transporter (DMT)-like permease